jgi:DNA replication protein DnaC
LPIAHWHEYLGEPTVADALLDRLLHNSYKLELKGESLRKREKPDDRSKVRKGLTPSRTKL